MKRKFLLLLLAGQLLCEAQNPITLGNSNMPSANDTLRYTNVQTASVGNYTQTGTNFNWDFSTLVSTTEGVRKFVPSTSTAYAFYFLSAGEYGEKIADTMVGGTGSITITNYYNFYKKQTSPVNAFIADGAGMTISGIPVPSYYSDKDELYLFPMSFPKYDSTTFKFSTLSTTLIPIKYSKQGYRTTLVDGWGTVKTPYGTDTCLRLITTQYSQDTILLNIPIGNLPPIKIGIPNNQRSYQWMTRTSKIPYMEVSGTLVGSNFTITQIRYRGYNKIKSPPPNLTGINQLQANAPLLFFPNPVKDKLWLSKSLEGSSAAKLIDLNGRLIRVLRLENMDYKTYFDVSDLTTGLYFIEFSQGDQLSYIRFIKD